MLSSIGAAVSLVRAEVTRERHRATAPRSSSPREAERACVASGAAPATVTVETAFDAREGVLRAVATGAVALEVGAADREPAGDEARLQRRRRRARARARGRCSSSPRPASTASTPRTARAASPRSTASARSRSPRTRAASSPRAATSSSRSCGARSTAATRNLGVATLLPRVSLVCGSRILDLSDARRPEDVARAAARLARRATAAPPSPSSRARCRSTGKRGRAPPALDRRRRSAVVGRSRRRRRPGRCRRRAVAGGAARVAAGRRSAGARRARAGPDPLRVGEPDHARGGGRPARASRTRRSTRAEDELRALDPAGDRRICSRELGELDAASSGRPGGPTRVEQAATRRPPTAELRRLVAARLTAWLRAGTFGRRVPRDDLLPRLPDRRVPARAGQLVARSPPASPRCSASRARPPARCSSGSRPRASSSAASTRRRS